MTKEDQIDTIEKVDSLISAEIPDENEYPELRKIVLEKYVHGPCGQFNPKSACMRKDKKGNLICSKGYPKPFKNRTTFTKKCYPEYRRRTPERGGGSATIKVAGKPFTLDSQWIVPYNKFTAWKYNAHLNLEAVENVSALKYLFKYVAKGTDKAVFKIVPDENEPEQVYDQIRNWLTGRYLSSMEASYRILAFPISQLDPSVKRLDFHLPGQQSVSYNPNEDKAKVLKRASQTMLTEWFTLNQNDEIARNFTYREIILFYTWVSTKSNCKWKKRVQGTLDSFNFNLKRGNQIGYLPTVLPSGPNGVEKLALYLLLLQATGAKSFEDLRTIDGIIYRTF